MPAAESVWQRLWEYPFYQNALAAGLAVALLCSVLSVFVVLRRMAFIGQGISHAAFGGAGLALLLGLLGPNFAGPLARDLIIAAFCVATALLIGRIARQQRVGEDSAIGICLVAAMALGVILLNIRAALYERLAAAATLDSTSAGYTPSFHDLLFGNILSIPRQEVVLTWVVAMVLVGLVLAAYKELVFVSFDPETAEVFGVRTSLTDYGLLVVLGVTIVLAMRLLGVILASAMLILPAVAGRFWSRRIERMMIASVLCGMVSVVAGLLLSMWLRVLSTGPVIVLTLCGVLGCSYLVQRLRQVFVGRLGRTRDSPGRVASGG